MFWTSITGVECEMRRVSKMNRTLSERGELPPPSKGYLQNYHMMAIVILDGSISKR